MSRAIVFILFAQIFISFVSSQSQSCYVHLYWAWWRTMSGLGGYRFIPEMNICAANNQTVVRINVCGGSTAHSTFVSELKAMSTSEYFFNQTFKNIHINKLRCTRIPEYSIYDMQYSSVINANNSIFFRMRAHFHRISAHNKINMYSRINWIIFMNRY